MMEVQCFMKRMILAIACCAGLLAGSVGAKADFASDQNMANRYLRAARSGDDDAQFYLGSLYSAGIGVPRSDEEAFRWFARAADQGHSHAMLIVGGLYAIGRGAPKDNVEGISIRLHRQLRDQGRGIPQRLAPADGRAGGQDDGRRSQPCAH